MKTTVIGAFPKISDDPAGQEVRRALHRLDRGEIKSSAMDEVFDNATRAAMAELASAGIDVINDGQIRWDDLFAPFARSWGGVKRGPLERFYDNNTYFRQPVIEKPITTHGRTLVGDLKLARAIAKKELKGAVCGPLTFATLTAEDKAYRTLEERTLAVADAITAEIRGLGAAGARLVDVEDPAVAARPDLIGLARQAYERLAAANVPLALHAYFFPADPILDELATFPVAQIGIDLRSRDTKALERIAALKGKTVVLGAVDARNTRLESPDDVAQTIDVALRALGADMVWAAPTTGLEYLPHDVASKKLAVLVAGARAAQGAGVGAPASGARA
jgi:5-methyltetrahydropteroyltriglutamate--homocysteine methyltransferase